MTDCVLLQDDAWTLEKMSEPGTYWGARRPEYVSIVKHVCYPEGRLDGVPGNVVHQVVIYPEDHTVCWRCGDKIPESMVACWKFQNWEALNYGG